MDYLIVKYIFCENVNITNAINTIFDKIRDKM